jgi:hypothetical protein|tara:strand:+ start:689 stop:913 length:225 start_codon:yes stop_codon:yes gene_type:complete
MDILEALDNGRIIDNIQNIITPKKNNNIRPLITNLNSLPFPDRDLFYKKKRNGGVCHKKFYDVKRLSLSLYLLF